MDKQKLEPVGHYKTTSICQNPYIGVAGDILYWGKPNTPDGVPIYSQETVDILLAEIARLKAPEGVADEPTEGEASTSESEHYLEFRNSVLVQVNRHISKLESKGFKESPYFKSLLDILREVDDDVYYGDQKEHDFAKRIAKLTTCSNDATDIYFICVQEDLTKMNARTKPGEAAERFMASFGIKPRKQSLFTKLRLFINRVKNTAKE